MRSFFKIHFESRWELFSECKDNFNNVRALFRLLHASIWGTFENARNLFSENMRFFPKNIIVPAAVFGCFETSQLAACIAFWSKYSMSLTFPLYLLAAPWNFSTWSDVCRHVCIYAYVYMNVYMFLCKNAYIHVHTYWHLSDLSV